MNRDNIHLAVLRIECEIKLNVYGGVVSDNCVAQGR